MSRDIYAQVGASLPAAQELLAANGIDSKTISCRNKEEMLSRRMLEATSGFPLRYLRRDYAIVLTFYRRTDVP